MKTRNVNPLSRLMNRTAAVALALVCGAMAGTAPAQAQQALEAQVRLPNGQWYDRVEDLRVKVLGGTLRVVHQYDGYRWQINPAWNSLQFEFDNAYSGGFDGGFGCSDCGAGTGGAAIKYTPPETEPDALSVNEAFGGTRIPGTVLPVNTPPAGAITVEYGPLYAIARNSAWFNVDSALKTFAMSSDNRYTLKPLIPTAPPPDAAPAPGLGSVTATAEGGYAIRPDKQGAIPDYVQGFRWEDKTGDWIEYDRRGRILQYGDRNNIRVSMVYSGDVLAAVKDHNGKTVLTFDYSNGRISAIKDNPDGGAQAQRVVRYGYNDKGSLASVTDPMGYVTRYAYDDKERLSTITDPENRTRTFTYTATNRIKSVTEADGGKTEYEYDYNKTKREFYVKVSAPVLPDGQRRSRFYTYNTQGRLLKMQTNGRTDVEVTLDGRNEKYLDENGLATEVNKNEYDLITAIRYPDGSAVTTSYDNRFLNILEERDENGVANGYEYDNKGNLVKAVAAKGQPEERTFSYTLNNAGQWTGATRPGKTELNGTVTPDASWSATYDDAGNRTSLTDAEGFITRYEYDRGGNLTKLTDPKGSVWRYEYDLNDRLVSVADPLDHTTTLSYDRAGNLLQVTDGRGKHVSYTYDARDRETRRIDHYGAALTNTYDIDGRLTGRIDASGKGVQIESDVAGRPIKAVDGNGQEYRFDYTQADGQDKGGRAPSRIVYPTFERQFQYNERNRVTRQTDVSGQEGRVTNLTHDRVGRVKTLTDANGKTRYIDYDAFGNAVKLTDPLGNSMTLVYNVAGDLIELKDYNGNATRFAYDKRGLMTQETEPLGKVTRYRYDARGDQTQVLLANGKQVSFTYDDAGRLIEQQAFTDTGVLEQTLAYSYDAADNLTGWNNGSVSSTLEYDDADRLSRETVHYGGFRLSHAYTYYDNNQVKTYTGPDGVAIAYRYDATGQLDGVDLPGEGSISVTGWNWAQPKKIVLPGGTTQEFEHDGYQELTRLRVKSPGQQTLFELENHYGKLQEIAERTIDGNTASYRYDAATRLTGVNAGLFSGKSATYTLDAQGNRTTSSSTGGNWTYDAAGQLLQRGDVSYGYDAAGNLTRKIDASLTEPARTTTYAYDAFNRLVEVRDGNGNRIAQYTYDPFDRRLSKTVGNVTTYYLQADNGVLAEADGAGTLHILYGWHPEHPYSTYPLYAKVIDANASRYVYYHNDHLGTPLRITDQAGNLIWAADYDPFGKATLQTAADPALAITSNLRYPGQYFDAETGLHYNDRRYYDPDTGRYLTRDPLGFGGGANPYLYAKHSPVNFSDPTGEELVGYVFCVSVCALIDGVTQAATNCGVVDYQGIAIGCGLDCLMTLLPLPNFCGKFGKWVATAIGVAGGVADAADVMGAVMNSFPAETVVHARDAHTGKAMLKPIGEIKIGDEVLAWAEWLERPSVQKSKEDQAFKAAKEAQRYEKVTDVFVTKETLRTLVHLTLDNGETLTATDGHPVHTPEGWRDAILLKRGGQLDVKGHDGQLHTVTIKDVAHEQKTVTTYNLEVANAHTFFVGADGYLVHNGLCNWKRTGRVHVNERHVGNKPGWEHKTKFKNPKRIEKDAQKTVTSPDRVEYQGYGNIRYEKDFNRDIGATGERTQVVVTDANGNAVTTFPTKP